MPRSLTRIKSQGGSGTFTFKKNTVSLHATSNSRRYRFSRFLSSEVHSANIVNQTMLYVVASRRLKTIGGRGRLREVVVYESFQTYSLIWPGKLFFFFVLNRWSLMGDNRLREVVAHGGWTVPYLTIFELRFRIIWRIMMIEDDRVAESRIQ